MIYGLTPTGFSIKRLPEIKSDLENAIKAIWPTANVDPESVFGQLIGVFSKPQADLWEQLEKVYESQWPSGADGVSLDHVLEYNGLTRLGATKTEVKVGLKGTAGTTISMGKQVKATDDIVYEFLADTVLTDESINEAYVTIDGIEDEIDYTITINTDNYIIDSGVGASKHSIADALVTEINDDVDAVVVATLLSSDDIQIDKKPDEASFDIAVDSNMSWYSVGTVKAINAGKIFAPQNTLTTIETPVSGWDAVNNFISGIPGRDTELDAEARLRRLESIQITGAGTLPSIIARIRDDVEDVIQVRGFENRTDVTDGDGRPPHSFEIVVEGGEDADIGNKLWEVKPAGIQTYSSSSDYYDVTDSNGDLQRMYFTRPILIDMYIRISLTLYDEETFPAEGTDTIKQNVLDYGNTLEIGEDVIPQRFFGSIYEVPGIEEVLFELSDDGITYQTTKYPIAASELSNFDLTRIEVIIL